MCEYIAEGNANSFRKMISGWNMRCTMHWQVPMVPFVTRGVEYIKNEYQLDSPRFNIGNLPFYIDFKAEPSPIPNSISTTPNSPYSLPDSALDESQVMITSSPVLTQNDWTDADIPHSYIDISSFDTPETLEKYVIQIDQFYASGFPSCRHLLFFGSEKEVMYHIVEAHIEPTEKRFVCINCAAEFDELEEADQHARQNTIPNVDVLSSGVQP